MAGSTTRYTPDQVSVYNDEVDHLRTPGGTSDEFTRYDYTRHTEESRITSSDPGQILAGSGIQINADHVLNDKSRIVAGGGLGINARQVDNVEIAGERHVTESGTATSFYRIRHKGSDGQGRDTAAYTPPTAIQAITLRPSALQSFSAGASNLNVSTRRDSSVKGSVDGVAGVSATGLGVTGADLQVLSTTPLVLPSGKTVEVKVDITSADAKAATVIRAVGPNTRLPDNSLFKTNPDRNASYLVETDARFTNQKSWLGSDYMMSAFTSDPNSVHKRLGDGFYEQRLVREQIISLTGQRYLAGYSNDESQFKALMDAGIIFGKQYGLTPGVALTAEQMKLLTSDMVWLVAQNVTLPDGTVQSVLVPQVYARLKEGDLDGSGALLAGRTVGMNLTGDLNNSGRIQATEQAQVLADNLNNLGGVIHANDVALQARTDISNLGGLIQSNNSLTAVAGRDINATTASRSAQSADGNFSRTMLDRAAGFYVQQDDGKLLLQAQRDVNLTAARVINSGENSTTAITAGRDINLNAATTASRDAIGWDSDNRVTQTATRDVGSEITGNGDVHLSAGHDVTAVAANVNSGQTLTISAGNDLSLRNGVNTDTLDERHKSTGSNGFASKTTTIRQDTVDNRTAQGSVLSADQIALQAGHDLNVIGSDVAATQAVSLAAGNDLTITAADEQQRETHLRKETKSGLMGSGGIGFTVGSTSQKNTTESDGLQHRGSTIGSEKGSLTMTAGSTLAVNSSDVIAGQDISLKGKAVAITAADNQQVTRQTTEQKQSGFTLALSGSVGGALNTAVETAQEAKKTQNGRLKALQGVKAALSVAQAGQAGRLAQAQGAGDGPQTAQTVGISISYGSQSSKLQQTQTQHTAQGSGLTAGQNLSVTATDGDITVQGSELNAGHDLLLDASRDIQLLSAVNSQHTEGNNQSQGGSIGISLGVSSSGSFGLSISASVNAAKGNEHGDGLTHTEALLNAGRQVTLKSGRDTTLEGAQVKGEQVTAKVGRDLLMRSEQDSDRYDSKQQSMSAGVTIPIYGGGGGASLSFSKDKMHSNFNSVQEQTGISAGSGGFDVYVGNHTQLDGAVIGSTASADKNRLDTGTLGFNDIHNQAEFETSHVGGGMSTGGPVGMQMLSNVAATVLSGANDNGNAESTTQAAVSSGTLVIRDKGRQTQDVSQLSRDTAHAENALSPIFDKEKAQNRMEAAQLIADIGMQALDIASTEGAIASTKAANAKMASLTPEQRSAARSAMAESLAKGNGGQPVTEEAVTAGLYQQYYNDAMSQSDYGTGGRVRQGIQAAVAVVQGLAGGNLAQALTGGAAPYIAEEIHRETTDENGKTNLAANAIAHALLGAALAEASGNSAAAGAAGAVSGELAARALSKALYGGKSASELTEAEKQELSTLATVAGGLAAGLVGNTGTDAVAGAQAGQNAVENNALSDIAQAQSEGKTLEQKAGEYVEAENERYKKENCAGLSAEACSVKMYDERRESLKETLAAGADFVPVVGDIKSFAEAQSALDYLAAAVGLIPGAGDAAGKAIKAAETALKKGELAEASKLINRASSEVSATSSLHGAQLTEYYRQAEKYGQDGIKSLEDGRFRFYGNTTPAKTQGEMAGARLVREWDPATGQTRTWYETLDHSGNVRSVAPKPVTDEKNHHIFDADGNYQGRR
ncbi:hemagglutinin repeat-containing protein [Pectobacteriaceae bacterium CE90]|nr:hemagglutinin repeat-containing protein [Pectobacteriaceae bacterium CE90]